MLADDRRARICGEGELADLYVVSILASLGFSEADTADFRMAIGRARDVFRIDWLARFARDLGDGNQGFHRSYMRQLRRPQHDVADGVDAGLGSLHPGISLDEATVGLDLCTFQADIFRAWLAPHSDQNLLRVNLLLLAFNRDGDGNSRLRLLNLVDLRAGVEVDAA